MPNGTVKFFNTAKGFGFITPDEGTKDVFVPTASITAAGVPGLKAGQRVSFNTVPDAKGPKAIDLKITEPEPKPLRAPAAAAKTEKSNKLTLYIDPGCAAADDVLTELRRSGQEPLVVDYMAAPPSKEELKNLSVMMREGDQSAVRRFEPLFHELRLDDRFISDGEFWEAIFEHPALINGPILATAAKARLCRSKAEMKAFLAAPDADGSPARRKGLSPGLLRLMSGNAAPSPMSAPVEKPQLKAEMPPVKKIAVTVKPKSAKAPAKPKSTAKAKPAPKAAVRKPAKKAAGKAKKR